MGIKLKVIIFLFIATDVILILYLLLRDKSIPVLNPAGVVAIQQRNLFLFVVALGLATIVPVVLFIFFTAYRYREDNTKAKYTPNWNKSKKLDVLRWGIFSLVIGFLAVVTWNVSHSIDPWKPIPSENKPLTIQVIALQWRWLFIYPEQKIATINYVVFPEKTPVTFELTADAPMNSFWIPSVAGQMYAMTGMSTKNHVMVNKTGEFAGSSAEISGTGFAKMRFVAKSTNQQDFDAWVKQTQQSPNNLTYQEYTVLAKPSTDNDTVYYTLGDPDLYNKVMMKFMPMDDTTHREKSEQMPTDNHEMEMMMK